MFGEWQIGCGQELVSDISPRRAATRGMASVRAAITSAKTNNTEATLCLHSFEQLM